MTSGRHLRALTIVDVFTRAALTIAIDQGAKGEQVLNAHAQGRS